jgi:hypothetical protein
MEWLGKGITLEGKTKKGRERVKRFGSEGWTVVQVEDKVQFDKNRGPWLRIENGDPVAMRWVHATNDFDFIVHTGE